MIYRSLGRSGLRVSCLGIGGNIFGRFGGRKEVAGILAAAAACGINLVDTADVYSEGESERLIGEALAGSRDSWIVATKLGLRTGESYRGRASRKDIMAGVEASLARLRTDRIDLYQLHHFDSGTPLNETIGALDTLKKQGKIRAVGASNYTAAQLREALKTADGLALERFCSVQCAYNLMKREIEGEMLPLCGRERVGVLAYAAMARGVLSGKYSAGSEPPAASRAAVSESIRGDLTPEVLGAASRLKAVAGRIGRSTGGLALAWVLRRPEVASVLLGVRDARQLAEDAADLDRPLTDGELREIEEAVGDPRRYESLCLGDTAALNRS